MIIVCDDKSFALNTKNVENIDVDYEPDYKNNKCKINIFIDGSLSGSSIIEIGKDFENVKDGFTRELLNYLNKELSNKEMRKITISLASKTLLNNIKYFKEFNKLAESTLYSYYD